MNHREKPVSIQPDAWDRLNARRAENTWQAMHYYETQRMADAFFLSLCGIKPLEA